MSNEGAFGDTDRLFADPAVLKLIKTIEDKLEDLEERLKEVEAKLKKMDSSYNIYPEEDNMMQLALITA